MLSLYKINMELEQWSKRFNNFQNYTQIVACFDILKLLFYYYYYKYLWIEKSIFLKIINKMKPVLISLSYSPSSPFYYYK